MVVFDSNNLDAIVNLIFVNSVSTNGFPSIATGFDVAACFAYVGGGVLYYAAYVGYYYYYYYGGGVYWATYYGSKPEV